MTSNRKLAVALGYVVFALGTGDAAQLAAAEAPLYDVQQLPARHGRVQQFTLTSRGDIDGLILTDGIEVKTPPHLSTEIAYSIKPGDPVTIHGLQALALPLIQAVSITDEATGRTVIDNGPPGPAGGPGLGPRAPIPGLTEVEGHIRMPLHGPRGDVNGALLDDGTILRLPPPEAERFATLLQPGQVVVARGAELATAIGKVMEIRQIGASRDQLSLVETPPDPFRRPPPRP